MLSHLSSAGVKRVDTLVQPGDTINQIFRKQSVANESIYTLNQKQYPEFNSIKPGDEITLIINDQNATLLTCSIHKPDKKITVNKLASGYQINTDHAQPHLRTQQISSQQKYAISSELAIYQRMLKTIFPKFEGIADVLLDNQKITAIKAYHRNNTEFAFIKDGHYQIDSEKHARQLISRLPTNYKRISSPFDLNRKHPITHEVKPHHGIDLAAPINTPVWSALDGEVVHKSTDTGYGNMLIIKHQSGIETYYAHLNKFYQNIQVGQKVRAFETIGYVGSTGRSTGPHLHFELRINDKPIDPLDAKLPNNGNATIPKKFF